VLSPHHRLWLALSAPRRPSSGALASMPAYRSAFQPRTAPCAAAIAAAHSNLTDVEEPNAFGPLGSRCTLPYQMVPEIPFDIVDFWEKHCGTTQP